MALHVGCLDGDTTTGTSTVPSVHLTGRTRNGDVPIESNVGCSINVQTAATAARGAMPMIRVLLSRKFWPLTMAAVSGAGTAGPMTHRSSASSTPSTAVARLGCFITNLSRPAAALTRSSGKLAG